MLIQSIVIVYVSSIGQVTEYTNKQSWINAVGGDFSTITFTDLPTGTFVSTQYSSLGITFDGTDTIDSAGAFVNDGKGLDGNGDIVATFSFDQHWIAMDFPGPLFVHLYHDSELIHASNMFGGSGAGHFAGLYSLQPFNKAVLIDPAGLQQAAIDDLFFGPPIPAPGALVIMLGAAALVKPRRRVR